MCQKTCIFCFFPITNKYLCMAKRSLLSRCPSYMAGINNLLTTGYSVDFPFPLSSHKFSEFSCTVENAHSSKFLTLLALTYFFFQIFVKYDRDISFPVALHTGFPVTNSTNAMYTKRHSSSVKSAMIYLNITGGSVGKRSFNLFLEFLIRNFPSK